MMDNMSDVESSDVPEELSSDKVELSEEAESIAHSPEAEVSSNTMNLFSQKQTSNNKTKSI